MTKEYVGRELSLVAYPNSNTVRVGDKTTTYYKTFGGKKYSFLASKSNKREADKLAKFRREQTGYNARVISFAGRYLIYIAASRSLGR